MKDTVDIEITRDVEEHEVAQLGVKLSTIILELEEIKDRKPLLEKQKVSLAEAVQRRTLTEIVTCTLRPVFETKEMQIVLPNGDIHETRSMTDKERQMSFKFEGMNDPEKTIADFFGADVVVPLEIIEGNSDSGTETNASNEKAESDVPEEVDEDGNRIERKDGLILTHHANGVTTGRLDHNAQPESIGEIETDGEEFPKKEVKETKIKFDDDLQFGAALKVAKDANGHFHFGWRIASTGNPKASHATKVLVNGTAYEDYNRMLGVACNQMIERLTTDPKFKVMAVERTGRVTKAIEDFAFTEEQVSVAAAAD